MKYFKIIVLLALITLTANTFAQEIIYPTTVGELTAEATIKGHGNVSGLIDGEEARIETITFQNTEFQTATVIKEEMVINGKIIYPQHILDEFGNKYLLFHINENGDFNYEISASVTRKALVFGVTDYDINESSENVKSYTEPSEKVESTSTEILTLTKNKIVGNSFVSTLNQTVDWVNDYVEYASGDDFRKYYLEQYSAVQTLINKKGVCDEFANLGAAILRAKKIPTRLAIGLTYDGLDWGNHAWIEVYHEKLKKWIPSDPTFREAGFVDAMHLKLGSFDDVTNSKAKCFYPGTATCTIENPEDLPYVKIISKAYMANVQIDSNITNLTAGTWNAVPITITNITTSLLSIPVRIRDIKDVLVQDKKKSAILEAGENETFIFKVMPKIFLEDNQLAKGTLVFNSLSTPYEKEVTVVPGNTIDDGDLVVEDITPIAHEGTLKIQITSTNYYSEDKNIQIKIQGANYSNTESENIPAFSTKTVTKEMANYEMTTYDINITTPNKLFFTKIIPVKSKSTTPITPRASNVIEQKLAPGEEKGVIQKIVDTPVAIILGILAGIIVSLFGMFLVNKRYV
ncbi:MAG: transglutaminase domain-containing protein [archaeon]